MPSEPTSIEHGSFDTAALQIELAQALEDDRKYKLTDNMKKRAIHTASSYDEFKVQSNVVSNDAQRTLMQVRHSLELGCVCRLETCIAKGAPEFL